MRKLPLPALIALLGACAAMPPAAPAPVAKPIAAKPFAHDAKTGLLEFHYAWPAEAAALPNLVQRFTGEMRERQAGLLADAAADKAYRDREGYPFHGYSSSTTWTVAGQSPRLLSLSAEWHEYTGGAHGMHGVRALLWDRATGEPLEFAALFARSGAVEELLKARWCAGIAAERRTKRGAEPMIGGMFDECPKLADLSLVPQDADGDGLFDTVALHADPYVAGPYAEGSYEVRLAVTPAFLDALKPEYRPSFEAQPQ